MDTDIDQQLRDYQREYLDFLDDDVSMIFNPLFERQICVSLIMYFIVHCNACHWWILIAFFVCTQVT